MSVTFFSGLSSGFAPVKKKGVPKFSCGGIVPEPQKPPKYSDGGINPNVDLQTKHPFPFVCYFK